MGLGVRSRAGVGQASIENGCSQACVQTARKWGARSGYVSKRHVGMWSLCLPETCSNGDGANDQPYSPARELAVAYSCSS